MSSISMLVRMGVLPMCKDRMLRAHPTVFGCALSSTGLCRLHSRCGRAPPDMGAGQRVQESREGLVASWDMPSRANP